jgi:hypothetical protein
MHINSTNSVIPIQIVVTPSFATGVITGAIGASIFAYAMLRQYERQQHQKYYPPQDVYQPVIEVEATDVIAEAPEDIIVEDIILEAEPKEE